MYPPQSFCVEVPQNPAPTEAPALGYLRDKEPASECGSREWELERRRRDGWPEMSLYPRCAPGFLGETCQFPDPCRDTQLCKNGGSCQALLPTPPSSPSPASPLTPSFSCTCPSGFTGERCQIHLEDLCPPSFCFNGGHCYVQASGRPRCSCEPGWTGKHPGRQSSGCRDKHQAEASEGFVLVQPCQLRIMVGEPCGGNRREAGRPCFMSVALVNT